MRLFAKMLASAALLGAILHGAVGIAQPGAPSGFSEQSIEAAYLYKFAGYVRWPDAAGRAHAPIVIGVLGADAFAQLLAQLTVGHTIDHRPIDVRLVEDGDSFDKLDILFVGYSQRRRLREALAPLRNRPVLTVTDMRGALDDGSIINFRVRGHRVRFEISLYGARRSRLQLSSRLLAVAERVYGGRE
jgi:hypothetical protein